VQQRDQRRDDHQPAADPKQARCDTGAQPHGQQHVPRRVRRVVRSRIGRGGRPARAASGPQLARLDEAPADVDQEDAVDALQGLAGQIERDLRADDSPADQPDRDQRGHADIEQTGAIVGQHREKADRPDQHPERGPNRGFQRVAQQHAQGRDDDHAAPDPEHTGQHPGQHAENDQRPRVLWHGILPCCSSTKPRALYTTGARRDNCQSVRRTESYVRIR